MMACIAIVEWPVNRLAFAAFFQESPEFASLLAFFVGVALAFLAHFIGLLAKRVGYRDFQRSRRIRYWSGIIFCLLFALLVIYTVTLARHAFLILLTEANVSAVDLFRGAVQEKIAESFFSPRFAIGDYALLVVNMLVLTIAIAFSFSHHDEHPDYASALTSRDRAIRAFDKAKREYDRHYAETRAEFDSRVQRADHNAAQLHSELQAAKAEHSRVISYFEPVLGECSSTIVRRLATYMQAYRRAKPAAKGSPPGESVPEVSEIAQRLRQGLQA
jgi:hypothetical protein